MGVAFAQGLRVLKTSVLAMSLSEIEETINFKAEYFISNNKAVFLGDKTWLQKAES